MCWRWYLARPRQKFRNVNINQKHKWKECWLSKHHLYHISMWKHGAICIHTWRSTSKLEVFWWIRDAVRTGRERMEFKAGTFDLEWMVSPFFRITSQTPRLTESIRPPLVNYGNQNLPNITKYCENHVIRWANWIFLNDNNHGHSNDKSIAWCAKTEKFFGRSIFLG